MSNVTIYTKDYCGFCAQAKALLSAKGIDFIEIDVTEDRTLEAEMVERSGRRTVPQIFIDDRHVGGFDDLAALEAKGRLDPLLKREAKDVERYLGALDQSVEAHNFKPAA
jgi:glutaredoxin 3